MKIIEVQALPNGAHRNQTGEFSAIPDGWAVIPEDMTIPDTFPFVNIEAEEITHYRNVETKTDENGEEYTEQEMVAVQELYTVLTVTSMTAGVMPEPVPEAEPEPTQLDRIEAQVAYTAMMTDTLLEV